LLDPGSIPGLGFTTLEQNRARPHSGRVRLARTRLDRPSPAFPDHKLAPNYRSVLIHYLSPTLSPALSVISLLKDNVAEPGQIDPPPLPPNHLILLLPFAPRLPSGDGFATV